MRNSNASDSYLCNNIVEKTIFKVRKGVIKEHGSNFNIANESEFDRKLNQFIFVDKDVQRLNL